ncbi:MAG: glycoside hydrolase family 127 protein, partial [Clostridia bacterium]|nr:glycoside hydrolase family 127 protein [Clostridia bacterium]
KEQITGYVDHIFAASESVEDGYFSVYDLLMSDGKVFLETDIPAKAMALFNLGYLLEFGTALYDATGDARILRTAIRFLNFTVRYSNHGARNFVAFHTGIEYNILNFTAWLRDNPDIRENEYISDLEISADDYLELCWHLISYRGVFRNPDRINDRRFGSYGDDHVPFYKISSATGHVVESNLYYFALSEYARRTGDMKCAAAAYRIWENLTNRQMYVIGGAGSIYDVESFAGDYYMPNSSYTECCTSAAIMQFSDSLSLMFDDSKYQNVAERIIYNNLLGSIGSNGTSFFYKNPLYDVAAQRWKWHIVPCCTKYGLMVYGNLPRYIYSFGGNDIYVNHYIGSTGTIRLSDGKVEIKQKADWAYGGRAELTVVSGASNLKNLFLRIPDWSPETEISVNGEMIEYNVSRGYAVLTGLNDGDTVRICADMTPLRVYADKHVEADVGRVALQRGPLVYCMEGTDNVNNVKGGLASALVLPEKCEIGPKKIGDLYGGVTALTAQGEILTERGAEPYTVTLIPWFSRANRGPSPVNVWIAEDPEIIKSGMFSFGKSRELKQLGVKYTAETNALEPKGDGSRDISVITDGKISFLDYSEQFDSTGAKLSGDLGTDGIVWFGVKFEKEYCVSHVVFWEGAHWNRGGWFGDRPYVQIMRSGEWVDADFTMTPEYPDDYLDAQQPANERYIFTLAKPETCSAVRVLGRQNSFDGYVSCSEIEVYGCVPGKDETSFENDETVFLDNTDHRGSNGKMPSMRGTLGLTYVRSMSKRTGSLTATGS